MTRAFVLHFHPDGASAPGGRTHVVDGCGIAHAGRGDPDPSADDDLERSADLVPPGIAPRASERPVSSP